LGVGDTGAGEVNVTPVTASVTAALVAAAVASEGRVGLAFVQAVVTTSSASALQIPNEFSFMCSYRGFESVKSNDKSKSLRDKGWETCQRW
jgi:hypothetical protein